MNRLIKLFSLACLFSLCLFAVSCDDDDAGCATYFLTEASSSVIVEKLYYNDDGLLAVALQAVDGNAPRRDEYSYNANRQLIRVDIHNFFYNTFSYNDDGDIESIKMYSTASDELNRELKYFYDVDGKLTRREFHQPELIYFELYEDPSANVIEVLSYEVDEEGNEEQKPTVVYTMDSNPNAYPKEWSLEQSAFGSVVTPNIITSYEVIENGIVDATRSYSLNFEYNEGGYPKTGSIMGGSEFITYTYSCEPVKEP
jgi:hypothetical protein